ncbi:MAG: DUF1822 family protein [Xenococcus sp. (in: cyanobacteria)]
MMLITNLFKVPLPIRQRICAEKFSRQQNNPQKAKQVYLNTLAVSAVAMYLNNLGWMTNYEQSDSWNPIMQTLLDVADLEIPNYGKIECRAVLLEQQELIVPPEVRAERIAYVIVKFGSSLQECELLGFVPEITADKISLTQLQSIGNLTTYLREFKQLQDQQKPQSVINLNQWWQGIIDDSWQLVETIFPPQSALSFRSPQQLRELPQIDRLSQGISRVKLLSWKQEYQVETIALILQLDANDSGEIDISAKFCPINTSLYLPPELKVMILDETQNPVLQAQTNIANENLEFLFSGEPGEIFSIQASLQDNNIVETFMI